MEINQFISDLDQEIEEPDQGSAHHSVASKLFGRKITGYQKVHLYRQFHTLIKSGVDVKTSLELIKKQFKSKTFSMALGGIIDQLILGKSLHEAFGSNNSFGNYECFTLKLGEETGKLESVLLRLATYFENKLEQRRQFINAITYPIIIMISSIIALSFMILVIVPMFEEIFLRFNKELPLITRLVLSFSDSFSSHFPLVITLVALVVVVMILLKKNTQFMLVLEQAVYKIPFLGSVYRDVHLGRFCASMGLLIESKISIIQSIDFARDLTSSRQLSFSLKRIRKNIIKGRSLHEAMRLEPIFEPHFISLIKVGEEVNQLSLFFNQSAKDFHNAVSYKSKQISVFVEPAIILLLGLIVGLVLIAMYLPMFELSSSIEIS